MIVEYNSSSSSSIGVNCELNFRLLSSWKFNTHLLTFKLVEGVFNLNIFNFLTIVSSYRGLIFGFSSVNNKLTCLTYDASTLLEIILLAEFIGYYVTININTTYLVDWFSTTCCFRIQLSVNLLVHNSVVKHPLSAFNSIWSEVTFINRYD